MAKRTFRPSSSILHVLILTQHFAPEITAGRFRLEAFAAGLVARGHRVRVLCPVPNHPSGMIEPGYRRRLRVKRTLDGAEVTYAWVWTRPRKTMATRLGYYGSYAALAALLGGLARRPDVIVASSPPLPVAAAGALLAARHRAPWIFDVRDLWPESAVALGEIEDGPALRLAQRLERALYRRADMVITVNDAFRRQIAATGGEPRKVEVIPNGTTVEWIRAGEAAADRSKLGLPEGRFMLGYAGNIGLAHALEEAVDALALLGPGYRLLVIGEGPRRAAVERRAADVAHGLVDFRPLMPAAKAAHRLRACDALLLTERQDKTVSSKLYDYCAVGRPVIAVCRGELRRLVEREGVALAVPLNEPEALAAAVRRLESDDDLRGRLVARGREFAGQHLRERQALRLAVLAERLAGGHGQAGGQSG